MGVLNKLTIKRSPIMKSKILLCAGVIALAGSIIGLTRTNQNEGFSGIQLANIEALARGEAISTITAVCNEVSVAISKCVVYCPRCLTEWRPSYLP